MDKAGTKFLSFLILILIFNFSIIVILRERFDFFRRLIRLGVEKIFTFKSLIVIIVNFKLLWMSLSTAMAIAANNHRMSSHMYGFILS